MGSCVYCFVGRFAGLLLLGGRNDECGWVDVRIYFVSLPSSHSTLSFCGIHTVYPTRMSLHFLPAGLNHNQRLGFVQRMLESVEFAKSMQFTPPSIFDHQGSNEAMDAE